MHICRWKAYAHYIQHTRIGKHRSGRIFHEPTYHGHHVLDALVKAGLAKAVSRNIKDGYPSEVFLLKLPPIEQVEQLVLGDAGLQHVQRGSPMPKWQQYAMVAVLALLAFGGPILLRRMM